MCYDLVKRLRNKTDLDDRDLRYIIHISASWFFVVYTLQSP